MCSAFDFAAILAVFMKVFVAPLTEIQTIQKFLANEAYFENLISFYENHENDLSTLDLLHSQKYSYYTEELEVLANFLLKQIVFKSCTY